VSDGPVGVLLLLSIARGMCFVHNGTECSAPVVSAQDLCSMDSLAEHVHAPSHLGIALDLAAPGALRAHQVMRWNPIFRNAFKNGTKTDLNFVVRGICHQSTTSVGFLQFNFVFSPWEPLFASRGASQIVGLQILNFNIVFQGDSCNSL
jgi:hypothetical protein